MNPDNRDAQPTSSLSGQSPQPANGDSTPLMREVETAVPPGTSQDLTDDVARSLHPNFIQVERLVGWIVAGVASVGISVGLAIMYGAAESVELPQIIATAAGIVVAATLLWSAHFWPPIAFRHRSWRLDDRRIEIRKGVLWRRVLDVPRSRVQHTDVNQGPIERHYGLAHLVIHTAGTTSADVTLEGLSHDTAVRIRDHLVETGRGDAV